MSGDRLRALLYELCLDKSHGSSAAMRQRLLTEIYEILQQESNSKEYLRTAHSLHLLTTYCSLHTYLLSHKETCRASITMLFIPLYAKLLE